MTKSKIIAFVAALAMLGASTVSAAFVFNTNLGFGMRNDDVRELQLRLNQEVGTNLPGTTYFGTLTRSAAQQYQTMKGITPVSGYVGPLTRAALNSSTPSSGNLPAGCTSSSGFSTTTGQPCNVMSGGNLPAGCTSTMGYSPLTGVKCDSGSGATQSGPVMATIAMTNPASGTIVTGQATANLAEFTFTGNGTVTGIMLTKTGISANDTLSNVYLYDGATRLTDAASVVSNGTVTFNMPTGIFMVNGSKTISVKADIKTGTSGQTVGIMMTGFSTLGSNQVTANLSGNLMSIAAATDLATAVMPTSNTVSTSSVDAGTSNHTIWGNTLQISNRTVWLKGANFRVIGSAETGALQNARLIVDGAQVGSPVASVVTNGYLGFDLSSAPISLNTGSHTIEVRADIVGGANRSFYVSLQNAGDIMVTDSQYNVNVALQNTGPVTFTMNTAGTISINSGTLSLAKDTTFNTTTNITSGASNITIGKYTLRSYGEAVKVMQVLVDIDLGTGTDGINNVGLYLNGAQVGSSQSTVDEDDQLTFNLGSSLMVPAGQAVTLEIRADIIDETSDAYTGTITSQVTIPVNQAQGQSSYALYPTGSALTSATTVVTAGAASATVSKSSGFLTTTVNTSATNAKVGSFTITAGTTEALRVTNLEVVLDQTLGTATTGDVELTDIANLKASYTLPGASAVMLNSVNPQATNNFSTDFTIPAGAAATVDFYVDVTNATAGEVITTNLQITARGASSNVVLSSGNGIANNLAGQDMTVGSGGLTDVADVTIVSSQATSARYVLSGSTIEPSIRYSVKPSNGAITIEEMTFGIGGTANLLTAVSVQGTTGGSTCTVQIPSGASTVTITGCSIPVAYTLGGTDLIVTPTINTVGINGVTADDANGATLDLTSIKYNDGTTSTTADLDGADDDDDLANLSASNAIYPVASMPTLTLTGSNSILANGEIKVGTVTISASAGGNINLETLPITYTLSGGALTNETATKVFVLKEGSTTVVTSDSATDATASEAAVVTFTNDEIVVAGSSRSFDVYMNIDTVTGDNDSLQISLAPSSGFTFDDINGGGADLVGTYILNYPSNSVTIVD